MEKEKKIFTNLRKQNLSKIHIDEILNYLDSLEYELESTRYIGQIIAKNERLAKYFFLRDKFKIDIDLLDKSSYFHEILDQCIDWSEFWRLLVIKKGFCCIRLSGNLDNTKKYVFLFGPNILSKPFSDISNSIHDN